MKEPTIEEVLEIVSFKRDKDGKLYVSVVYGNVGYVRGDVHGWIDGNVGTVGGNVGYIRGKILHK